MIFMKTVALTNLFFKILRSFYKTRFLLIPLKVFVLEIRAVPLVVIRLEYCLQVLRFQAPATNGPTALPLVEQERIFQERQVQLLPQILQPLLLIHPELTMFTEMPC